MAFVRHFFGVFNRTYTNPTVGSVPPLSTPACRSCATYEANAGKYLAQRLEYSPEPLEVREISLAPGTAGAGEFNVDVVARQRVSRGVDPAGKVVETLAEKSGIFFVTVRWVDGHWLVREVKVRSG